MLGVMSLVVLATPRLVGWFRFTPMQEYTYGVADLDTGQGLRYLGNVLYHKHVTAGTTAGFNVGDNAYSPAVATPQYFDPLAYGSLNPRQGRVAR